MTNDHFTYHTPVEGCISAIYPSYSNGVYHSGIDISRNDKKPVYSVSDGGVVLVTVNTGSKKDFGTYVLVEYRQMLIDGKPLRVIYGHLTEGSIKVKNGDTVTKETILGLVGCTGNSTGPHLHLEFRKYPYAYRVDCINPCTSLGVNQWIPAFDVTAPVKTKYDTMNKVSEYVKPTHTTYQIGTFEKEVIVTEDLNVREKRNLSANILSVLPKGTKIKVNYILYLDDKTTGDIMMGSVYVNGQIGFISMKYTTLA